MEAPPVPLPHLQPGWQVVQLTADCLAFGCGICVGSSRVEVGKLDTSFYVVKFKKLL